MISTTSLPHKSSIQQKNFFCWILDLCIKKSAVCELPCYAVCLIGRRLPSGSRKLTPGRRPGVRADRQGICQCVRATAVGAVGGVRVAIWVRLGVKVKVMVRVLLAFRYRVR
eukprot:sb/3477021/